METLGDTLQPKISTYSAFTFYCKICDYVTSKKCNYNTHILSAKHKRVTNDYNRGQNSGKGKEAKEKFICSCGKEYQYRQGLWKHTKVCKKIDECVIEKNDISEKEIIIMLLKQNSELMELIKNGTNKNISKVTTIDKVEN
jgi:hypothetical protein